MADTDDLRGVVLITVDSLRADAVRAMPTVRGLADRGCEFERAFAAGNWTPFSFPSILGADPVFCGGSGLGPSSRPTLAETLSAAGVDTVGINAANGFLTGHWGYDRGFDRYESFGGTDGPIDRFLAAHPTVRGWCGYASVPLRRLAAPLRDGDRPHAFDAAHLLAVERRARELLRDPPDRFFLWCHYMDTHTPYAPAPRYVGEVTEGGVGSLAALRAHVRAGLGRSADTGSVEALRALYDAAARQVDASIGRLLETLEAVGLRDRTLVAVAGDHGEEFGEHGHLAHYPKLYDELTRVPLLVVDPRVPGRTVDAPVSLSGLPPTVTDALGAGGRFDGESLLPAVHGGPAPAGPVVSVALRGESVTRQPIPRRLDEGELLVSARDDRWTHVYHAGSGHKELYDRRNDPGETENVYPDRAGDPFLADLHDAARERVARIEGRRDGRTGAGGGRGPDRGAIPDRVSTRLRALGYR